MQNSTKLQAFVLQGMEPIARDHSPTKDMIYDQDFQVWINRTTKEPLVCSLSSQKKYRPSSFGETLITETREGIDQTEISSFTSKFGETQITATGESTDQSEVSMYYVECVSEFGETLITRTQEGVDQSEIS